MEFKDISVNTVDGTTVAERYRVAIGEVTRARVGLRLAENERLESLLPVTECLNEESFILREHAEAVVAGNLALIRSVVVGPYPSQLSAASETVESGLAALQQGAIAAADFLNEEQAKTPA